MNKNAFVPLLAVLLFTTAHAQDTVLRVNHPNRFDSINSPILQQKRYIQVFLPEDYTPGSGKKYDVLYVLDGGNWNTGLINNIQRFIEGIGNMPPTIVVSVMGIDRNVELTPTHLDSWKGSGGGEKFLAYITKELIPHVDSTYPTNGDNTLWGHSLSGMFAVYAMLNAPTVFKSFIATDPSIWWDNCLVAKMAATKFPAMADFKATLYVSGREGQLKDMRIDTLETVLKTMAPPGLRWTVVPYKDESHNSVRFKTTYDGLKFTYAGFVSEMEFAPEKGILMKDMPVKIFYFDDTARVHYTLDGTTPTELSPGARKQMTINGPAKITFKRFTNRSRYDKTVSGEFVEGGAPQPIALPRNARPGGFSYAYYEGDWDSWPDLKKVQPVRTGIADKDFDADKLPRSNKYALVIEGYIEIKEEGYYIFLLDADKNSRLFVGGKPQIQWDGNYNHRTDDCLLPLSKGFYPFRIEYLHQKEDFRLRFTYLTPSLYNAVGDPIAIPFESQYSLTEPAGTKRSSAARLPSAPAQ